jgi:hypothetical protein
MVRTDEHVALRVVVRVEGFFRNVAAAEPLDVADADPSGD